MAQCSCDRDGGCRRQVEAGRVSEVALGSVHDAVAVVAVMLLIMIVDAVVIMLMLLVLTVLL